MTETKALYGVNRPEGEIPKVWAEYVEYLESLIALKDEELGATPSPEARGIAWADFFSVFIDENNNERQIKINVTQRSDVSAAHALAIFAKEAVAVAKAHHLRLFPAYTPKKPAAAPKPTPVQEEAVLTDDTGDNEPEYVEVVQDQPKKPVPVAKVTPVSTPVKVTPTTAKAPVQSAPVAPGTELSMAIEKILITPKPEGKVVVDLFAPGHQYADLRINWTREKVQELFPSAPALNEAAEYTGNWIAHYKLSEKLNGAGNPYKNVTRVEEVVA